MRRTTVAAVAAVALVGVGAGAAVTAYDDVVPRHPTASTGWHAHMGTGTGAGTGRHMAVPSEREFLADMVAHHEEAIRAAGELARSDRPLMRDFGAGIVAAQSAQVDLMEGWLHRWYDDDAPDVDYRPMMRDLSGLGGDRLDRTFLQDMVRHHMAAVMMAQHLLASGRVEHDEVGALARDIRADQSAEIRRMRRWLAEWFG